jgi:type I restriction enzyme S subunit
VTFAALPLKYAASLNDDKLPESTDPNQEFRYLDIGSVGRGYLTAPPESLTFVAAPSRARRLVAPGDTIISTVRTYLRAVWAVEGSTDDLVVSTGFAVVRPRKLDAGFLRWAVQADTFIEEVVGRSTGVSYPAINPGDLAMVPVHMPPADQQRRIADFLDSETARIDALIAAKQQMCLVAESAARSMLDEAVGGTGWRRAPLRRFVSALTQGTSGIAGSRPAEGAEWGLLKLSAVRNGEFRPGENKVVDDTFPVDERLRPVAGDLLVTRSNTPAYVGDACAVRSDGGQVLLPDLIYRLRLDDRLDPVFASMALRSAEARHTLSSAARGTSQSMVKLRGEDILNVIVPVPPLAEQQAIVQHHDTRMERVNSLVSTLAAQIELLRERRQALITAAVTGEIEV